MNGMEEPRTAVRGRDLLGGRERGGQFGRVLQQRLGDLIGLRHRHSRMGASALPEHDSNSRHGGRRTRKSRRKHFRLFTFRTLYAHKTKGSHF
jgi:hypothetical protein